MLLLYTKFFLLISFAVFFSLAVTHSSIISLLLHSELLVVILFCIFCIIAVTHNVYYLLGIGLCYLIFGSLELALNLLLLIF